MSHNSIYYPPFTLSVQFFSKPHFPQQSQCLHIIQMNCFSAPPANRSTSGRFHMNAICSANTIDSVIRFPRSVTLAPTCPLHSRNSTELPSICSALTGSSARRQEESWPHHKRPDISFLLVPSQTLSSQTGCPPARWLQ